MDWTRHLRENLLLQWVSAAPRRRHAGTRTGIAGGTAGRGSSGKVDRGGSVSKKNHHRFHDLSMYRIFSCSLFRKSHCFHPLFLTDSLVNVTSVRPWLASRARCRAASSCILIRCRDFFVFFGVNRSRAGVNHIYHRWVSHLWGICGHFFFFYTFWIAFFLHIWSHLLQFNLRVYSDQKSWLKRLNPRGFARSISSFLWAARHGTQHSIAQHAPARCGCSWGY